MWMKVSRQPRPDDRPSSPANETQRQTGSMDMPTKLTTGLVALLSLVASAGSAQADAIDGNWCIRSMAILKYGARIFSHRVASR